MILKIKTTGKIICRDLKKAESLVDLGLGLLRKKNPRSILFKTRFGIHTFFLKETIDVVILDQNFKVVKLKQNLKPNSLFFWNPTYPCVLELPKGFIKKYDLRQDQTLIVC